MYNLIQGDCLEEMDKLIEQGVKVDMVLTDPPYGTTQCKWDNVIQFEPMWNRLNRIDKENGAILLFGNEPFSSFLRCSNIDNYRYDWVWEKNKATQYLNAKRRPLQANELISVFYSKLPLYTPQFGRGVAYSNKHVPNDSGECYGDVKFSSVSNITTRYPRTVLKFDVDIKASFHPTQKPVALLEYLIKTYTNEGETVLDFTMGSGSTGVACFNTNRNFIGIELDQKYYDIAKSRIEIS